MNTTPPPAPAPALPSPAQYDAFHTARARTDLVARMYAAAMGADYPFEIGASSSCDWPLLGLITSRLSMRPGQLLVDAGCGTGGIGLWLARALALRLDGFDLSPVAVTQATARRPHFLGSNTARATFRVADLQNTSLPTSAAHSIVCIDALGRTRDRDQAVAELGRVLAPGGRLVMTRSLRRDATPTWVEQAAAAGLIVEHVDERPGEPAMWERLYSLWITHADELRRELGDAPARSMLAEAEHVLPALPGRRAVLLTLYRHATAPDQARTADRMARPDRHGGRHTPDERTPQ
ncbi:class I SAM-dependent methyltransferase (plasmid) [Streptomyces clavifer]|uniref:class I SAM-dependent methyltransferase n=1 Tax=Streptomyces TaxID=1883 RepID=UPI0006FA5638|nr:MULTISPECIES: class I SAM-dependent methyltransferase [Streptomyces]KQZ16579.1 methyltransferase [Streptomyces sp. Root55]WUC32651.1 class I SAM-dependent methyltransferase [Streptomyces clavifer]